MEEKIAMLLDLKYAWQRFDSFLEFRADCYTPFWVDLNDSYGTTADFKVYFDRAFS